MSQLPENHPLRKKIAKREGKAKVRFEHIEARRESRSKPSRSRKGLKE